MTVPDDISDLQHRFDLLQHSIVTMGESSPDKVRDVQAYQLAYLAGLLIQIKGLGRRRMPARGLIAWPMLRY